MNDGSETASAAPASTRRAARPAKFFAAAWSMRKKPHMKMSDQTISCHAANREDEILTEANISANGQSLQ